MSAELLTVFNDFAGCLHTASIVHDADHYQQRYKGKTEQNIHNNSSLLLTE
jgi:hypothetical protein